MSRSMFQLARGALPQSLIGQFLHTDKGDEVGDRPAGEYVACLIPLLNAFGWRGDPRHVAEAVPHFDSEFDIESIRNILANLNLPTQPHRIRQQEIDPDLLPCLFVPDDGPVRVVISTDDSADPPTMRIFDGETRAFRDGDTFTGTGTAYYLSEVPTETALERLGFRSWFGYLASRLRILIWQALFLTLLFNLLSLASALFVMTVYDRVIPSGSAAQLAYLLGGVLLAAGFESTFRVMRARSFAYAAGRIDHIAGVATFQQVLFLPAMQTENAPLGTQITRLREFESVRDFFSGPLGESLLDLPFSLLFIGLIALIGGPVVYAPLALAIAFLVTGVILAPVIRRLNAKQGQLRAAQQRFLIETLGNIRTVKLLAAEREWLGRYRTMSAEIADTDFRIAWINHIIQTLAQLYMLLAGVAVISAGALRVMNGDMSSGALIATMILTWRALAPLQGGFTTLIRIEKIRSIVGHINALMRLPMERAPGAVPPLRNIGSSIVFSGVAFRFGADKDPSVLGVSFEACPGEIVAITGPNGCGKTTLIKLASGQHRAQGGTVLIDGVDIRQIDPIDLRQRIASAPQVSEFFHGTIAQNLRMAEPTANDQDIAEAARKARLLEEVIALPNGFETRLTDILLEQLSAGFKRKLNLARAYLRRAPILLLDEPAQSLDEPGEAAFIGMLRTARGKQTILMTTHRPSHMRLADKLIVLSRGRILFNGPPDAFLDRTKEDAA
jgi:ATP-binding cassette subfamily C protein/ATP-binding cassette subfamily C protein LapB